MFVGLTVEIQTMFLHLLMDLVQLDSLECQLPMVPLHTMPPRRLAPVLMALMEIIESISIHAIRCLLFSSATGRSGAHWFPRTKNMRAVSKPFTLMLPDAISLGLDLTNT